MPKKNFEIDEQLLFVYGTLMTNESNCHMLEKYLFVAQCRTQPLYTLIDLGSWPALVLGGTDTVVGELFRVPLSLLRVVDDFEEVPMVYRREDVSLVGYKNVQAYLLPNHLAEGYPKIISSDWRNYREKANNGLR